MAKQEIKESIKKFIENFESRKLPLEALYGIVVANFVIQKETFIKKYEETVVDENENTITIKKILFDFQKNEQYLPLVNNLANYIRNHSVPNVDTSTILLENHDNVSDTENIKENIGIIQILRNSIAHGKYEIEGDILKIHNAPQLECDIPLKTIEAFNQGCMKLYDSEQYDIAKAFKDFCFNKINDNGYIILIYTYSLLVFADANENSYDNIDIEGLSLHYNMTQFACDYRLFQNELQRIKDFVKKQKEHYDNCSNSEAKNRISSTIDNALNSFSPHEFGNLKKNMGSRIRNTLLHGNCLISTIDELGIEELFLFDRNNQCSNYPNTFFRILPLDLFKLSKSINGNSKEKSDASVNHFFILNFLSTAKEFLLNVNIDEINDIIEKIEFLLKFDYTGNYNKDIINERVNELTEIIFNQRRLQQIMYDIFTLIIKYFDIDENGIENWEQTGELSENYLENLLEKMKTSDEISSILNKLVYLLLEIRTAEKLLISAYEYYLTIIPINNITHDNQWSINQALETLQSLCDFDKLYDEYMQVIDKEYIDGTVDESFINILRFKL